MIVHGKERGFTLTVRASMELAELCPEKDLTRIGEAMKGTYQETLGFVAKFICLMNKGYEENKGYEDPAYKPDPLTEDEVFCLPMGVLYKVRDAAMEAFSADTTPSVEVEPEKKEKAPK